MKCPSFQGLKIAAKIEILFWTKKKRSFLIHFVPSFNTSQLTLCHSSMEKPTWIRNDNDEILWGNALGFGATTPLIDSKQATIAFVAAKQGISFSPSRCLL
jgi:hypothetical protein